MKPYEIKNIAGLSLDSRGREMIRNNLRSPYTVFWKDTDPEMFSRHCRTVMYAFRTDPPLAAFLQIHLIVQALLHRDAAPDWYVPWLTANVAVSDTLPVPLAAALASPWRAVPAVLATAQRNADIVHFIAGRITGAAPGVHWPGWAEPLMAPDTRQAIADAAAAVSEGARTPEAAFWIFPLAVPNGERQFEGGSLGLPAALAFRAALKDRPLPPETIATGVLRPDGAVSVIAFPEEKAAEAAKQHRVFIYPVENILVCKYVGLDAYPVKTLSQAWMITQLYRPDDHDRLFLLSSMLTNPRVFVRNLHAVPAPWLQWCLENGSLTPVIRDVRDEPPLFAALTDQLAAAVRAGDKAVSAAVAALVDPDNDFPALAESAPLTAFRWAGLNLCMNNHRGRTDDARFWSGEARNLINPAFKADIHMVADFFNFEFVARHNRYDFQPEMPYGMKWLLEVLEKQYAHQCEFGCPTHLVLGRIYGTLAQNFGFCGPAFLAETRNYAAKARQALGENAVPEYRDEWLRQYNHLAYALLDAGDGAGAREALLAYLQIDGWDRLPGLLPGFTPWQHAITARFFGDTGDDARSGYYEWCRKHPVTPPTEHPWQLWCFNMGRIAAALVRPGEAADWFRRSLDRCGADHFGPTVHAMALLPWSALNAMGASINDARDHERRIRRAAKSLNPDHFRVILEKDVPETLAEVAANPARLFPFSYR